MKVNLVGSIFVLIVFSCLHCDVFCLPNPRGTTKDNVLNTVDSPLKVTRKNSSSSNDEAATITANIAAASGHGSQPYSSLWKVFDSEESIRAIQAKIMKSYMNFSVDPCDDFYEYACGNWENVHPIPKDKSEYSLFSLLNNNIQNELREILTQPITSINHSKQELSAEEKAKVYFMTCIDEETINRRGVDPLLYFIDELGGWPVLDENNWSEKEFDWLQLSIKTTLLGYPAVIFSDVEMDLRNSTRYAIYLEEGRLGLSNRDDYLNSDNEDHLDAYRNLIVTVLRLLDVDPEKAEETSKEIVDFEIQLANITTDPHVRVDLNEMYIPKTIAELNIEYENIDWIAFFSGILETRLHPNQTIVVLSANYYGNLTRLLKDVEPKTLANYMIWRGIHPFLDGLDENFRAALQTFKEALTGQKEPLPRWKECLKEVNTQVGMATGAMFVQRYFDEDSKNETVGLLSEVKDAFTETLMGLEWIDERTKELAHNKVNKTKLAVGYPDFILNPTELNKLYSDLKVMPEKRFENTLNLVKYSSRERRVRFSKNVDKEMWPSAPAVVNAFFEQTNNRIVIPVGILQPPVFHKNFPRALNYGSMGAFVGHELTHGFDDVGREFDSAGNMIPWWSMEAVKGFQEREKCFVDQYGNFSVNGKFLPGIMSKGENIADNGGVRQAFRVYRKWQIANKKSKRDSTEAMPGLNLTNDQLFFVAYGQSWCNAIRPEALENRLQTNFHCPGKFRVIGALANFEDFSDVFQCPVGSKMNPTKKCRMW
ncbi:neprilysin-4-like [Eupeodes corollae]|uniref:neprilysin-4-like n=1 Tax=Eupeodes corollae TaxID=290404 RepID=UPI0024920DA8|nr:neprilysin-4-like [Eupeodes corollae]